MSLLESTSALNSKDYSDIFPLKSIGDVVNLFKVQLQKNTEPDLTLLSIVTGYIEHILTSGGGQENGPTSSIPSHNNIEVLNSFPIVTFEAINSLYKKFESILLTIDKPKTKSANRLAIKKVSDLIWNSLIRGNYKDKAHIQNLYSYLISNKLDCFGVAFAVVAGCQVLGYKDVHLAISEDHAWVVFGKNRSEAIEVTWHGKGHEDKRGQDVSVGYESQSWLYLAGNPVICDRYMEVAAIVSSINISLTPMNDCLELAELQQNLLWLLYDMGHLKKYPMALGNLGELEEVSSTNERFSCEELYKQAIQSAQENYKNYHVYPYAYLGGYYFRQNKYCEAFLAWAEAGDVIRLYNYSRDDEEIYKEFQEIANELIPSIMKTESSGHSAKSILRNPECFANLLRFYDGICQWEEESSLPILHIGWAKPLVNTISKFDYDIRSQVIIKVPEEDEDNNSTNKQNKDHTKKTHHFKEKQVSNEGNNNVVEENKANAVKNNIIKQDDNSDTGANSKKQEQISVEKKSNEQTSENVQKSSSSLGNNIKKEDSKDITKTYENEYEYVPKRPVIKLYSQKMKGLKHLLLAEKLNTHAISLQVTAQSHVGKKLRNNDKSQSTVNANSGNLPETEVYSRPKRIRREPL